MLENRREIEFLQYIGQVIRESRTKKRAEARISGLLRLRLEEASGCSVYDAEGIKRYLEENKKERTNPPNPLREADPSKDQRINKKQKKNLDLKESEKENQC